MINAATIVVRLCLLVIAKATPIKSKQYDCSYMNSTRITPMNRPNWMGKRPRRPQSYPKNLRKAGKGKVCPPQGRAHQMDAQYLIVSPKNIHTGSIIGL